MDVTAYFTTAGGATAGLSPTVDIITSAGVVVLTDVAMSEVPNANGWYSYDFVAYDPTENYIVTANAGTDSVDDRFPTIATAGSGMTEGELHDGLDSYVNKDDYKADVTPNFEIADSVWSNVDAQKLLNENLHKAVISPDDQHVTVYEADGVTISHEFDISEDKRTRTPV